MPRIYSLIAIGVSIFVAGCAHEKEPVTLLGPVGPSPLEEAGQLMVYTATNQWPTNMDSVDLYRYPHTGYEIFAKDGHLVKMVRNALSNYDEEPAIVTLRKGTYTVRAHAERLGVVVVPVLIRTNRLTEVHLEHSDCWQSLLYGPIISDRFNCSGGT